MRIFVADQDSNGSAESFAFKDAGKNLTAILLFTLGCDLALAGTTTIQFALNVGFADVDPGRTAIDHRADPATVRFAKRSHAKELAESVSHCGTDILSVVRIDHRQDACATLNRFKGKFQIVDQIAHVFNAN